MRIPLRDIKQHVTARVRIVNDQHFAIIDTPTWYHECSADCEMALMHHLHHLSNCLGYEIDVAFEAPSKPHNQRGKNDG